MTFPWVSYTKHVNYANYSCRPDDNLQVIWLSDQLGLDQWEQKSTSSQAGLDQEFKYY